MNKEIRLLSLFSGIGAFEKALSNLKIDYKLVNYCEFDKMASLSYSLIHEVEESLNLGDITKIDERELKDFDLMTYGFPCQAFSIAGKREGFDDVERGNLFFEAMRIAKYKKPKYMIAENVKGLTNHDKGNTFKVVLETLENIGYNNYYKILNSSDFGVPQDRERIFIVSIRKDIDDNTFKMPIGTNNKVVLKDIIDLECKNRKINPALEPYLDKKYHKKYKSSKRVKKVFDGNSQGYFKSDYIGKRIYSIEGVSPTLRTHNTTTFLEIKGRLNCLERMLLQGFDKKDYLKIKECISENQINKQTGNSITVSVLEEIFRNLFK